jgi:hypothetical protein
MTSAAERACALVGNMLAAGPCGAAEIRAAAEGDNISERTIQRAAIALGAVKTKAGFNGGWTWRLPDELVAGVLPFPKIWERHRDVRGLGKIAESPSRAEAVEVDGSKLSHPPSRAEVIAARLRKLEAGRGKVAPIHALDPRVKRWADSGISDPDLKEAYERAVTDIEGDGPVTAGFLDPIVMQVISEGAKA